MSISKKTAGIIFFVLLVGVGLLAYAVSPTLRIAVKDVRTEGKEIFTTPLKAIDTPAHKTYLTRQGVIEKTNSQRALQGFEAYRENTKLNKAAEDKVNDMFNRQYFEHVSPDGKGPAYLAQQVGYSYIIVGENLALGNFADDAALVQAWMDSPGHRANILHDRFTDIGVAVGEGMYQGKMVWLAVQEFGKPSSSCPAISTALKAQIDEDTAYADELNNSIAARKEELGQMPQETEEERELYNAKVSEYNRLVRMYNATLADLRENIEAYNGQVRAFNACLKE